MRSLEREAGKEREKDIWMDAVGDTERRERKRKQKGRGNRKEEETERKKVKEVEDFYFSKLYLLDKRFKFLFSPLSF